MREIIDAILGPAVELLNQVVTWLSGITIIASRGLDVHKYFGYFSWAGDYWLSLIGNIAMAALLVTVVFFAKSVWSLYRQLKDSVKWW